MYISTCLTAIPATVPYSQAAQPHNTTSIRKNARMELETGMVFVFPKFLGCVFLCDQNEISNIFLSIWAPFWVHFGSILAPFWVPGGGPARLGVPRVYLESFLSVFYDFAARPNLGPDAFTSIKTVGS